MITPSGWIATRLNARRLVPWLCAAAVGLALCWPGRLAAAPQWRVLETPRFTVVSQLGEEETRLWAEEFNQFIDAMGDVIRIEEKHLPKLTIVMFSRSKNFAEYRPIGENGKVQEWVAGYFFRQDSWGVIGMAENLEDESMRRLIYHEGVHWLASADQRAYPKWFDEGLAELFSTFRVEKGTAVFGKAIGEHVALLRSKKPLPIERLLLVSTSDRLFNETDRTGIFYAQSWAFVHYLVFGQRKNKQGSINDFLTAFYGENTVEEAFRKAFGMNYQEMDKAVGEYLREGKYFISRRPLLKKAKITAEFQPAAPAAVQVALARLAFGTGRYEKAMKHVDEAVRLDPNYAPGYAMQARIVQREDAIDRFLEIAQKSVQLGPNDPEALELLAQAKFKKALSLGGVPPAEAREIADLLEGAIDALPSLKYAYVNLAHILASIDKLQQKDLKYISQGRKLFPDEMSIVVGWVYVLWNQGHKDEATKLLNKLLASPEKLEADRIKELNKLKSSWDVQNTQKEASDLIAEKRFKEAVTLLDALLARCTLIEAKGIIVQQRGYAVALASMEDANKARGSGNRDVAIMLYERLLKMNHAPMYLKQEARQVLRILKGGEGESSSAE